MSSSSMWRAALPPLGYKTLGRAIRSGNRVQSLSALPITSAERTRWTASTSASTGTSSKQALGARPIPETGNSAPKWSGQGVLGVALAASLLGWGIATTITGRNGKGLMLLDSRAQFPRYASVKEMKIVSSFPSSPRVLGTYDAWKALASSMPD